MQLEITRTFSVPENVNSINQLEEAIFSFGTEVMVGLLKMMIRIYERDHYYCQKCRSRNVEPRGTKDREISLRFGDATIKRARVFCRECKTLSQPADALLDELEGGRVTQKLRELICLCAAGWSFEIAEGVLEDLCGVELSHETIRQLAEKEGQKLAQEQAERASEVVRSRPEVVVQSSQGKAELVCVEMDGGYVHSRENRGGMEGKVGLIYSEREKIGKERHRLVDKRVVVSFVSSERLGQLCYLEAKGKGVDDAEKKAVVGDGAHWIWSQKDEHFPEAKAILDLYHLKRVVWDGLKKAELPEGGRRAMGRGIVESLESGAVDIACGLIEGLMAGCEVGQEELSELLEYIRNNREAIPCYEGLKEEGYPVGSGAVEKQVDLVINRRMKGKSGMSWTRNGADAIAALRALRINQGWADHWRKRKAA
jgi:hypothetical protein